MSAFSLVCDKCRNEIQKGGSFVTIVIHGRDRAGPPAYRPFAARPHVSKASVGHLCVECAEPILPHFPNVEDREPEGQTT